MTLCNGRIKDGPTPVKAPHTRRRLTTLFLRPTLVVRSRNLSLLRVCPISLPPSLSLSFSFSQCTSLSHDSCLSLSLSLSLSPSALRLYLRLLDSPHDKPSVHSLALLIGKHAPSLSHSPPTPSRHTFPSLSCYLMLPSCRAISRSRVHSFFFLSSLFL